MNTAKYYIYRNLNKGCFSVKYKGKVIAHHETLAAHGVLFKVNELGRQRVIKESKKYVHAYVVCDSYTPLDHTWQQVCNAQDNHIVKYNPFKNENFMVGSIIINNSKNALLGNGNVFINSDDFRNLICE